MKDKTLLTTLKQLLLRVTRNKKQLILILPVSAVLLAFFIASFWISQPARPAKKPRPVMPKLIEVIPIKYTNAAPTIQVGGEVIASKSVVITPQVSGRIVKILRDLAPGTLVHRGDILVQIDDADYILEEQKASASLAQALASYEQELGEQAVAHRELEILTQQNMADELSEQQRKLILRHPQLVQAQAEVDTAKASLAKAKLDIERTKIHAPFTGIISEKYVDLGLQINTSSLIVELVDSEEYWVKVALPASYIERLTFVSENTPSIVNSLNQNETTGSAVEIYLTGDYSANTLTSHSPTSRKGDVYKRYPQLDSATRQAQILIRVSDPLALDDINKDKPELMLNDFVSLSISGKTINSVLVIDDTMVRNGNQVWIYDNGKLRIKTLDVIWRESGHVFLGSGLRDGDLLITTDIANAYDGLSVMMPSDKKPLQPNRADKSTDKGADKGAENKERPPRQMNDDNEHPKPPPKVLDQTQSDTNTPHIHTNSTTQNHDVYTIVNQEDQSAFLVTPPVTSSFISTIHDAQVVNL